MTGDGTLSHMDMFYFSLGGYVHRETFPNGKMAAIRLEDEAEFYVSE